MNTRNCCDCRKEIPEKASRCFHCRAFQSGWRRHFDIAPTLISVLAAVVSVISAVYHYIDKSLWVKGDHISYRLLQVDPSTKTISVLATNRGDRSGITGSCHLITPIALLSKTANPNIELLLPTKTQVEPGQSLQLVFTAADPIPWKSDRSGKTHEFTLRLLTIHHNSTESKSELTFSGDY